MVTVQLRDIVTEDDEEAVMGLRRGPGRDRSIGRMLGLRYGFVMTDRVADGEHVMRLDLGPTGGPD